MWYYKTKDKIFNNRLEAKRSLGQTSFNKACKNKEIIFINDTNFADYEVSYNKQQNK